MYVRTYVFGSKCQPMLLLVLARNIRKAPRSNATTSARLSDLAVWIIEMRVFFFERDENLNLIFYRAV